MIGFIDNYNFKEMEPMRYWAPPSSWTLEKKKETTRSRIFSGNWWAAEKKDGYFSKLVKDEDGNIMLFSRSRNVKGEFPEKHEWVPHLQSFFEDLPNGTCLLGELYLPSKPGSSNITSLLGCLKEKCIARQEASEKLHFYIFDILAWEGKSYLNKEAFERFDELNSCSRAYCFNYVEWAEYLNGKALWNKLQNILSDGGEGMVIIRDKSLYQPGKRPSNDCQKVKKELHETIDCFFTGRITPPTRLYTGKDIDNWEYWQDVKSGEMKYGKLFTNYYNGEGIEPVTKSFFYGYAGSLEVGVIKNNKTIVPIGYLSGLTEEIKKNYADYKGKPIEITAMEIFKDKNGVVGGLRHAKFLRFRPDLSVADCTYEKIFDE